MITTTNQPQFPLKTPGVVTNSQVIDTQPLSQRQPMASWRRWRDPPWGGILHDFLESILYCRLYRNFYIYYGRNSKYIVIYIYIEISTRLYRNYYIYYYIKIADDGCFILEDWLKYVKINILDTKMTIQPLLLSYDGKDEQDDEDLEAINLLVPTVPWDIRGKKRCSRLPSFWEFSASEVSHFPSTLW